MKTKLTTLAVAFVLAAMPSIPALAYPTGQAPTLSLSASGRLTPGQSVSATVARVKPGCPVSISWKNAAGISAVSGTSDATGKTTLSITSPNISGTYVLTTSAISAACAAGPAVTLTSSVVFGKIATITPKIVTSNVSAKKKPVISVSATVKSGTTLVKSKSITVDLNLAGKKLKTVKVKTDAKGAFTAKFTGITKAGKYTAVITFTADSIYSAAKVTTKALTLKK
jgi:hypothetical protein